MTTRELPPNFHAELVLVEGCRWGIPVELTVQS